MRLYKFGWLVEIKCSWNGWKTTTKYDITEKQYMTIASVENNIGKKYYKIVLLFLLIQFGKVDQ